jgi:hypothetical protein
MQCTERARHYCTSNGEVFGVTLAEAIKKSAQHTASTLWAGVAALAAW